MSDEVECTIVGGGAAGLSAALVLGRARRRALLVDAGEPSNAVAHGIGGLLGQDGRPPTELYAEARAHMAKYPSVTVESGIVTAAEAGSRGFRLVLADGRSVESEVVLLATGMDYAYPRLSGAAERWGQSVFHCPFCHGWEVHGRPLGVLGDDGAAVHRSLLLGAWSDDVTLFTDGTELDDGARERLAAAGVAVETRALELLEGPGRDLESVTLDGGEQRPLGGLLVPVTLHQRSDLVAALGVELAEPTALSSEAIAVDGASRTSVAGVWAAGDVCTGMPSVANSISAGALAASGIVGHLTGAI